MNDAPEHLWSKPNQAALAFWRMISGKERTHWFVRLFVLLTLPLLPACWMGWVIGEWFVRLDNDV